MRNSRIKKPQCPVKPLPALKSNKTIFFLDRFKVSKENDAKDESLIGESALDLFTKNLNPDLSYEVKHCWIDPDIISTSSLLGHGRPFYFVE